MIHIDSNRILKTLGIIFLVLMFFAIAFGERQTASEAWQDFLNGFRFVGNAIRERGFWRGLGYSFFGSAGRNQYEAQQLLESQ